MSGRRAAATTPVLTLTANGFITLTANIDNTSTGGDVTLTANGNGAGPNVGILLSNAGISTSGSGAISLTGTGVADGGIVLQAPTTIQTTSGTITLTGNGTGAADIRTIDSSGSVAVNASSGNLTINADSVSFGSATTFSGSGALTVQPRTAATTIGLGGGSGTLSLDDAAIGRFADGFSSITIGKSDSGKITVDGATFTDPLVLRTGDVVADANDSGTDLTAPSVTLHGSLAPGSSPGVFSVAGDFAFADNSTFNAELTGTPSGGSHDRLDVTGSVTIGSSVTLVLNTSAYTEAGGTLTLINNGSSAVSGSFSGLSEGGQTNPGNTPNFIISYTGGDGNDVTLTATNPTAVSVLSFAASGQGDQISLLWDTASEQGLVGFNLYRGNSAAAYGLGQAVKLNSQLIGGKTLTPGLGAAYAFGETRPSNDRAFYWLEIVHDSGKSVQGPVSPSWRIYAPTLQR